MPDKQLVAVEARVRLARRDMTQSDLARVLGVSKSTVHYWLAGTRLVTAARQRQLAEILGGPARTLFWASAPQRD